jgi:hypothetical protein
MMGKEHYVHPSLQAKGNSKAKCHLEIIRALGKARGGISLYPNGAVMIYVSCSQNPFRLQYEEDVFNIISCLGRVL